VKYIILLSLLLPGCITLTGVEHTVYGGVSRSHSGGEVFSEMPSGHEEQGGTWYIGSAIKTIWTVKK
jgi:hypothetical protein